MSISSSARSIAREVFQGEMTRLRTVVKVSDNIQKAEEVNSGRVPSNQNAAS